LRFGLFPFNVHRSRRTVRRMPASGPSRCGVGRLRLPEPCPIRPCGFSRLRLALLAVFDASRRRPRGSFVSGFSAAHVPGPRSGCSRDLAGKFSPFRRRSWDFHTLRSLLPHAGDGVLGRSTPRTHLPFRQPLRREFHRSRDSPNAGDVVESWPRLLGFGPAGDSFLASCRPRYSFCA